MRDGQPVPGFASADRDERVLVLNFWASWCPYCRSEHDFLMKLSEDRRLKLVGIVSDDREAHVAQYLGQHGNPYAQLSMDHQKVVIRAMRQRGLPTTMLIPANSTRVAFRHVGPITEPLIQPAIASALLPYQVG
jgi:cytochrome c biogenesis protein CcmG/thiol:disulfide interchange protein DsbE